MHATIHPDARIHIEQTTWARTHRQIACTVLGERYGIFTVRLPNGKKAQVDYADLTIGSDPQPAARYCLLTLPTITPHNGGVPNEPPPMSTATLPARVTMATIEPGQRVMAGYRRFADLNEFVGFTADRVPMFTKPDTLASLTLYDTYRALKSNVADESIHQAVFREVEDGSLWAAYRYQGRWVVGSSADAIKLRAVES